MTCFDCAVAGEEAPAVAVCTGCGVGLCMSHAVVGPRYLTRVAVINRVDVVETPARAVHCEICAHAVEAQKRPAARRTGRR